MSFSPVPWMSAINAMAFLCSQHTRLGSECTHWLKELPVDILRNILQDRQFVLLRGYRLQNVLLSSRAEPIPCYALWMHIFERARVMHTKEQFFFMRHFFRNPKRFWLSDSRQSMRSEMVLYETPRCALLGFEDGNYLKGAMDGILMLNYYHTCRNVQIREVYSEEHRGVIIQIFVFGMDFLNNVESLCNQSIDLARRGVSRRALEHCERCPLHKIGFVTRGLQLRDLGFYECKCPKIWQLVMSSVCFKNRVVRRVENKKKTANVSLSFISSERGHKIEFELY